MIISVQSEYTSVACNRIPEIVDWNSNGIVCYGASNAVVLYDTNTVKGDTLTVHSHHKARINYVKWLKHSNGSSTEFVSCSNDKTCAIWSEVDSRWTVTSSLVGHSEGVTCVDGVYVDNTLVLYTTSIDSTLRIWQRVNGSITLHQTISLGSGLCLTLRACIVPQTQRPLVLTALDDHKIHIYGALTADGEEAQKLHVLSGHEDWVRGLDVMVVDNVLLIASCSQDSYIRLWKLQPFSSFLGSGVHVEEKLFSAHGSPHSIKLDAVLAGHEAWVYGVHFHPGIWDQATRSLKPVYQLLSSSMDKTVIIWEPESSVVSVERSGEESGQGVWVEKVRVGEVGGNGLGFYGAKFGPRGQAFVAHGYNGSFHMWTFDKKSDSWQPLAICGGHFSSVVDLRWEGGGRYLVTASADQTSRVHARVQGRWGELARPQVHGYDLSSVSLVSATTLVSCAEEKVVRVLSAPRGFLTHFQVLTGGVLSGNSLADPEGATVPSLGLSNKAVYTDDLKDTCDTQNETYFVPVTLTGPPTEETLVQSTLWPETHKLYGHGYEVYCCDVTPDGTLLATACRATSVEHCAVIIWETKTWKQIQKLQSHSLTVTQLAFSPDSRHLVSVSRDRKWTLFSREGDTFGVTAGSDRATGIHTRIVWCCAWSCDSKVFATGSRDGKVCHWTRTGVNSDTKVLDAKESVTALAFAPKPDRPRILAVGLDNGLIKLYSFHEKWDLIFEFNNSAAHHMTVRRLFFKPRANDDGDHYTLASCGNDNLVRIYKITIS